MFSLFSVVNFPNALCTSTLGDNGTCITAPECIARSGQVAGTCASGFGACCVLYNRLCGGTVAYNNTYLLNPGYSSGYTTAGTCSWTFPKIRTDICLIRLDFDKLTVAAPDSTTSTAIGQCTTDYFQATNAVTGTTSTSGTTLPKICGVNDEEHMYVDAGMGSTSEATMEAVLTGSTSRTWKIKVSQIPCDSIVKPPHGCMQYHTGVTGQVRSFNFQATSGNYLHLAQHYYKACIRRERGYCKIAWSQSSDTDSFKISRPSTNYRSNTGNTGCQQDSVKIYGGSNYGVEGSCTVPPSTSIPTVDRYCGGTLTCNDASTSKNTIISARLPFEIEVDFSSTETAGTNNRGFCLDRKSVV